MSRANPRGNAGGNTVLPSMIPVLPYEVSSPGPRRSTSATASPRLARCSAVATPTMPAPSTIASVCAMFDPDLAVPTVYASRGAQSVSRKGLPSAGSPMLGYDRPAAALAWLGRQGTRAVALSLFAGLALPWLAAAMKPLFTPSVFVLLCLAFLRVDPAALRRRLT